MPFDVGLAAHIGGTIAAVADALLGASHWFALTLAVCLVLAMIVRRRIRVGYAALVPPLVVWYSMDDVDAGVHAAIIAHPWTAFAVLSTAWLVVLTAIGVWTMYAVVGRICTASSAGRPHVNP